MGLCCSGSLYGVRVVAALGRHLGVVYCARLPASSGCRRSAGGIPRVCPWCAEPAPHAWASRLLQRLPGARQAPSSLPTRRHAAQEPMQACQGPATRGRNGHRDSRDAVDPAPPPQLSQGTQEASLLFGTARTHARGLRELKSSWRVASSSTARQSPAKQPGHALCRESGMTEACGDRCVSSETQDGIGVDAGNPSDQKQRPRQ
jgi:hypothetical protein